MVVYIVTFSISILFMYLAYEKKGGKLRERFFLCCSFMGPFLVAAFRRDVGTDYMNYKDIYCNYYDWLDETWEPGFVGICKLVHNMGLNFQWIMAISAFLILFAVYYYINKEAKYPVFSLFIFFSMAYYFQGMNIVRQWLAIGIVMFGFRYLKAGNIKFFAYVFLACMFHKSAIVYLAAWIFLRVCWKWYYYFLGAGILAVMLYFHNFFLNFVYLLYGRGYASGIFSKFNFDLKYIVFYSLLLFLCCLYYKKLLRQDKKNIIFINMVYMILMLYSFCGWLPLISRVIDMFAPMVITFIPELLLCLGCKEEKKYVRSFAVGGYLVIFFYLTLCLNFHDVLPYLHIKL